MSHWFSVTSQLLRKLLASLVSLFCHSAALSPGNSAPWLWACVFLQAARINNMLTSHYCSAQRPQAPKHLLLFGTRLPITTVNPMAQAPPPSCYPLICSQKGFMYVLFIYFRENQPQFEMDNYWLAKEIETLLLLVVKAIDRKFLTSSLVKNKLNTQPTWFKATVYRLNFTFDSK